ncbi:MAG: sugar transferase [Chthoniobacteraceae bacterium]
MLGRRQELNLQFQQFVDGALLVVTFWVAYVVRYYGAAYLPLDQVPPFNEYRWVLFLLMPFGPIMLEMQGFYSHVLQKTFFKSFLQIAKAALWLCVLVALCSFFFKLEIPRGAVLIYAALAVPALIIREKLSVLYLKSRARHGRLLENVLLVGTPEDIQVLRASFTTEQMLEMHIAGELDIAEEPIATLIEKLHVASISRVIFAGGHNQMNRLQEAINACETEGVEAWLMADFIKTSIARPDFDMFGSSPILVFRSTPALSWALVVKGIVDFLSAAIMIICLSWLFLIVAIVIRMTSPGPIIFRQQRGGKHGKPFTMYKFRTMHTDAEMRRAELEAFNQMSGPVFKIEKDPRITPFGRFLRKMSIDELPQLLNVLQGSMSLVGPRPLPLYEVEKFENTAQRRRLSVKPGLTCLWQISGRNEVKDFSDWVKLDLKYIDNWSLWLDFKILVKTIPAVLLGSGAK